MSRSKGIRSTPRLERVADRLTSIEERAVRDGGGTFAGAHLLAALALGRAGEDSTDAAIDVAVALELIDEAIITHYYEEDRACDERLLYGDRAYAHAMRIVAGAGMPKLVSLLASATGTVARGHSLRWDGDPERLLALRSALFPAASRMGDALAGRPADEEAAGYARDIGLGREAILAGSNGVAPRLQACAAALEVSPGGTPLFGEEQSYIAGALRERFRTANGNSVYSGDQG